MKTYTITVNGNVYNVTVEEGTTAGVVQAPAAAPKALRSSEGSSSGRRSGFCSCNRSDAG